MPGELHAVIGPNGAGKTTLINQISGLLAPDAGRIVFAGEDVTRTADRPRARSAGSRARSRSPRSCRASRRWRMSRSPCRRARARASASSAAPPTRTTLNAPALDALAQVGLAERADVPAGELSHGEKRALELAIALAMEPKLLLLDEPMAGTGHEETERLVAMLRGLKGRFPIVLVEHDMDGGVRARRPHLGAGLRPHPRQRHAGAGARRPAGASPPISARRWRDARRREARRPATAPRRCCSA